MTDVREALGRAAFGAHVSGLAEEEEPPWQDKPPVWEELGDGDREFYMRIGAAIAETVRADAETKLAEVRRTVATFIAHYGHSTAASFKVAQDLAEAVRQVLDREPLETQERSDEKEAGRGEH